MTEPRCCSKEKRLFRSLPWQNGLKVTGYYFKLKPEMVTKVLEPS